MNLYKSHMRSKAEYCCIVWSPTHKKDISRLERIQKGFTKRIEGLEGKNYHQRLKYLNLYSMERRRERYMIINTWQQIEDPEKKIMGFEMNERLNLTSALSKFGPRCFKCISGAVYLIKLLLCDVKL